MGALRDGEDFFLSPEAAGLAVPPPQDKKHHIKYEMGLSYTTTADLTKLKNCSNLADNGL